MNSPELWLILYPTYIHTLVCVCLLLGNYSDYAFCSPQLFVCSYTVVSLCFCPVCCDPLISNLSNWLNAIIAWRLYSSLSKLFSSQVYASNYPKIYFAYFCLPSSNILSIELAFTTTTKPPRNEFRHIQSFTSKQHELPTLMFSFFCGIWRKAENHHGKIWTIMRIGKS